MSKPLELTVCPKREITTGITYERVTQWFIKGEWCPEPEADLSKRLTDAELAAEHWRAKWTGLMAENHGNCLTDEGRAKIRTVERFYQLPHYDEDAA